MMTQPGVLIMAGEQTLYSWAVVPTLSNVGGGTDRPVFKDVWAMVADLLEGKKTSRRISHHGFFAAGNLF